MQTEGRVRDNIEEREPGRRKSTESSKDTEHGVDADVISDGPVGVLVSSFRPPLHPYV